MSVLPQSFGPGGSPFIQALVGGALFKSFARSINFTGAGVTVTRDDGSEGINVAIAGASSGGVVPVSGAQISLTTLRNANETGTLTYDTEDFDNDNWADIVANATQFTVPAGITHARIGGQVVFATNVSGDFLLASQINNAPSGLGRVQLVLDHASSFSGSMRIPYQSGYMPVSEGDTLRIQTNGPDTTIAFEADGSNFFWVQGYNIA